MFKTTLLPSREDIIARLTAVNDTPWNVEKFYPRVAAAAGTERAGGGLPLLFELAIADVCDGDPLAAAVRMQVPAWLRALVDDEQVLADALEAFFEINPWLRGA